MTNANPGLAEQLAVRCVWMRGGTSKAAYLHEADVPPPGAARDRFLQRVMGTPDVMQIDGLGGSRLVTSKIALIKCSERADADVDYTFAQADVERPGIDYSANCGNISSGVGPFAVDEGLVEAVEPVTTVRIFNTNTGKLLVARVPVAAGKARVSGDCAIAGVPGTGAEILMDFSGTVGALSGRLLPSGRAVDRVALEDGSAVEATFCDAGNPCVFVHARDLGLTGSELPEAIMANEAALARIFEIQSKAAVAMGLHSGDWRDLDRPGLPLFVMVAEPAGFTDLSGRLNPQEAMDLRARLLFLGKCHESMAGSGSMCTAAASRVPGSVVHRVLPAGAVHANSLRIGHPLGVMTVRVEVDATDPAAAEPRVTLLGFSRTARRLMDGQVYVPRADLETGGCVLSGGRPPS